MSKIIIDRSVIEQALEALELTSEKRDPMRVAAISSLRTALAHPEPEPVGSVLPGWNMEKECIQGTYAYLNDLGKKLPVDTLLYTVPPQQPTTV